MRYALDDIDYTVDGRRREYGLLLFVMLVAFLFSTVVSFL